MSSAARDVGRSMYLRCFYYDQGPLPRCESYATRYVVERPGAIYCVYLCEACLPRWNLDRKAL